MQAPSAVFIIQGMHHKAYIPQTLVLSTMFTSLFTSAVFAAVYLATTGAAEVVAQDGFDVILPGSGVNAEKFSSLVTLL